MAEPNPTHDSNEEVVVPLSMVGAAAEGGMGGAFGVGDLIASSDPDAGEDNRSSATTGASPAPLSTDDASNDAVVTAPSHERAGSEGNERSDLTATDTAHAPGFLAEGQPIPIRPGPGGGPDPNSGFPSGPTHGLSPDIHADGEEATPPGQATGSNQV